MDGLPDPGLCVAGSLADTDVANARAVVHDAAILTPNCPVCQQSCALAARALEAAGVATVVMAAALDIVEHVGVPRLPFVRHQRY